MNDSLNPKTIRTNKEYNSMHLKKSVVPEVGVIMAHNLFRATSFIVGTTAHTAFKDAPSGVDSVLKRLIFIQNMCLVFGKPKMFDRWSRESPCVFACVSCKELTSSYLRTREQQLPAVQHPSACGECTAAGHKNAEPASRACDC